MGGKPKTKSCFARFFSTKRKAPGLSIIIGLGALHCIAAAALIFDSPDWRTSLNILIVPLSYAIVVTVAAFALIKLAEHNRSTKLAYFRDFNIWKGLALIYIAPAISFWIQLFRNYHYTLDIAGAFTTLLFPHVLATLFALIFLVAVGIERTWRSIFSRSPSRAPKKQVSTEGWVPNLAFIRVFFRNNGPSPVGAGLGILVGGAYLAFFYLTIASLLVPQSMLVKTQGTVASANTMAVMFVSKTGSHRQNYCLLTVQTSKGTSRFALPSCSPCMKTQGASIIVEHNPIDYSSRRSNSAQCLAAKPPAS